MMLLEIIIESANGVHLRFIHNLHLGDYMDFQAKFPQNSTLSLFSEGVGNGEWVLCKFSSRHIWTENN